MNTVSCVAQYVLVGLIVGISALAVFYKLFPKSHRWVVLMVKRLERSGCSGLGHALAKLLQPGKATGNCADGCAACRICALGKLKWGMERVHTGCSWASSGIQVSVPLQSLAKSTDDRDDAGSWHEGQKERSSDQFRVSR